MGLKLVTFFGDVTSVFSFRLENYNPEWDHGPAVWDELPQLTDDLDDEE